jgi:hypothetical protein
LHRRRKTTNFAPDKRPQRGGEQQEEQEQQEQPLAVVAHLLRESFIKTPPKERYQMHFNSIAKRIPEAITKCTATSEAAYQMTRSPPPHVT